MRYRTLALFCSIAAIAYVQRAALGVPAKEIAGDLGFADLARDMGMVQSAWYFGYALMQVPSGWVADRLGSRSAAVLFCLLWTTCTAVAGLATGLVSLMLIWGLMGICQAGIFPSAAKAIGQLFPAGEKARASGLLAAGMQVGGTIAPLLAAAFLAQFPLDEPTAYFRWRYLFLAFAIPGYLWVVLFLATIPVKALPKSGESGSGTPVDWKRLLGRPTLWLLCGQQFFRAGANVFFMTWYPTFLQEARGASQFESGSLATITGIGATIGSLTGGFASDWILRRTGSRRLARQGIAIGGMLGCAALVVASWFVADNTAAVVLISIGVFCSNFGGVSGYTVAIEFGGKRVATVFSLMNMCGNLGASCFPIAAGLLVAWTGNWDVMLFFFASIMVIGAFLWALLDPPADSLGETES